MHVRKVWYGAKVTNRLLVAMALDYCWVLILGIILCFRYVRAMHWVSEEDVLVYAGRAYLID